MWKPVLQISPVGQWPSKSEELGYALLRVYPVGFSLTCFAFSLPDQNSLCVSLRPSEHNESSILQLAFIHAINSHYSSFIYCRESQSHRSSVKTQLTLVSIFIPWEQIRKIRLTGGSQQLFCLIGCWGDAVYKCNKSSHLHNQTGCLSAFSRALNIKFRQLKILAYD